MLPSGQGKDLARGGSRSTILEYTIDGKRDWQMDQGQGQQC